jgi:hypothetical protein
MSMLIAPETPYGKELWKWDHHEGETHPQDNKIRGMRPREHRDYPKMLYKATQKNPWQFESHVVESEQEQRNLESRGFVAGGQGAAAEAFDQGQQALAVAAAVRNYEDRNLSEKAKAEIDAAESASARHLGEIPATPIKKRGRPATATPATE